MSCTLTLQSVGYGALFEGVSLSLSHKHKVGIVGPNGCGKSTLLKIAAGLIAPHQGGVELFHHPMKRLSDFATHRARIGYLFQDADDQFIAPSVLEDVAFGLLSQGESKTEAKAKALTQLTELGIAHLSDRIPMRLSGGEKRMVALAGVLVMEPDILLLDEPDTALDEATEERLVEILLEVDASVLVVSHSGVFLRRVCQELYRLTPSGLLRLP